VERAPVEVEIDLNSKPLKQRHANVRARNSSGISTGVVPAARSEPCWQHAADRAGSTQRTVLAARSEPCWQHAADVMLAACRGSSIR